MKQPIFPDAVWGDDASILRFVSTSEPLTTREYKPDDLVSMSGTYLNQAGRNSYIRAIAKPSMDAMAYEFSEYFGEPLVAISGFRSAEYQQRLWDLGRCDDGVFCAKPGQSEHQLGLAVDYFDAVSPEMYVTNARYRKFYEWMKENAYRYGWTQSYKHGPKIDGYEIEPWHWRYIGVEKALLLKNLDWSYTKFLNTLKSISQI